MATTTSNLNLIESAAEALVKANLNDYIPGITTNLDSGATKGSTVKVQVISGEADEFNASTNNYLTGSGTITGVDVVLNMHPKATFSIPEAQQDKVQYDNVVKGAIEAVLKKVRTNIWAGFTAAAFTNEEVIGAASAFDYTKFNDVKAMADTYEIEGANVIAVQPAYSAKLTSVPDNLLALEKDSVKVLKTAKIPTTGNVVGALFAPSALAVAFGAPIADGKGVVTKISHPSGFSLYVREVINPGTGENCVTVEAVMGRAVGIDSDAVILKSA